MNSLPRDQESLALPTEPASCPHLCSSSLSFSGSPSSAWVGFSSVPFSLSILFHACGPSKLMTCCPGSLSLRPKVQTACLRGISLGYSGGAARTCFLFSHPRILSPSFSSILRKDIPASLIAQPRNLRIILTGSLLSCPSHPSREQVSSRPDTDPPSCSSIAACWSPAPVLASWCPLVSRSPAHLRFLFRVFVLKWKSNHVTTLLDILQWLPTAYQSE